MLIVVVTPDDVYLKPQRGYTRYKPIYLLISNKLNKHTRFTWIVIDFHPVLTLEIVYGYYDDTSRLLAHARSWIIGD